MWPRPVPSENYIYSLPPTRLQVWFLIHVKTIILPYDFSAGAHRGDCLYLLDLIVDTILESGASNSHLSHFGTRTCMYLYAN